MAQTHAIVVPSPSAGADEAHATRFRDAYERHLPEMSALRPEALSPIIIDVPQAVTTSLGAQPELRAMRAEIARQLPVFPTEQLDRLEGYTLATAHAHALYLAAAQPPEELARIAEQASELRETMLLDGAALARRGLVDGGRLAEFRGLVGYRNVAFDLLGVAAVLRSSWPRIEGKTALEPAELDRAERLADQILTAVGEREQGPSVVAEAALRRQQAFTLFVRAYDQARRAVEFLRWDEGDADRIVPSLYAGRRIGRRKEPSGPQKGAAQGQPAQPSQPAGHPSAGAPQPSAPPASSPVAPGLPSSNPFAG